MHVKLRAARLDIEDAFRVADAVLRESYDDFGVAFRGRGRNRCKGIRIAEIDCLLKVGKREVGCIVLVQGKMDENIIGIPPCSGDTEIRRYDLQ